MRFSDISFKKKIFILLILPLAGFLWLSISAIFHSVSVTQEMSTLTRLTKLSVVYSELVHELQKERGMTAGFIGSHGESFGDKLKQQRINTNKKIEQRQGYWQMYQFEYPQIIQLNDFISGDLNQLAAIRRQVDNQSINLPSAIKYYTQLNAKLLSVAALNAEISSDATITKETIAYYNFLQAKERAGIERAVLSATFSADQFGSGMLVKFITLVAEQDVYFSNFNLFANANNKTFFTQQLNHLSVQQVSDLREIAKNKTEQFNIDSEYWFSQATARIGQLKKSEEHFSTELLTLAQQTKDSAFNALVFNVVFSLTLVLCAAVISFYTIRELSARVMDLTSVMAKVRDGNDLTVQTKQTGESELGQISTSLNLTLNKFSGVIEEISTSSISLASAAEETSRTCEHNSQSMLEQQDGIALIATAIEELSVTVKEVANNTHLTADSAKEADIQAKNGLEVVQISYQSIESLASEIDSLATRITSLHESSNNITKVVDVIKSVADQTNLLALNAAIEAARAGEQGRGFAVVADEVCTLAQRTQESIAEIENFIISLQSDANLAFNVIDVSQKKAAEAVANSKDVEQRLQGITAAVSHIFVMTEQIATAVEEQSVVTQDIAKNIVTVEQKSMESTTGATQIAVTAKEQAKLATSLQDIASTFKV